MRRPTPRVRARSPWRSALSCASTFAFACAWLSGVAEGAEGRAGVRIDGLQPAAVGSPFLSVDGLPAGPIGEPSLTAGLAFEFALAPLSITAATARDPLTAGHGEGDVDVVAQALVVHARGGVRPTSWLTADVDVPFALLAAGDDPSGVAGADGFVKASGPGLGEPRLGALFWPARGEKIEFGFGGRAFIPVGSQASYLGEPTGQTRFQLVATLAAALGRARLGCTTTVAPLALAGRPGDRLALGCAAHAQLVDALRIGVEPRAAFLTYEKAAGGGGRDVLVEALGVAVIKRGAFGLMLAGGPGFGDAPGVATVRAAVGFEYTFRGAEPPRFSAPPPTADGDLDGLVGAADKCPNAAGPASNRGCPAADADGDGVPDATDVCPTKPGLTTGASAALGCPDGDNDGLADPIDPCPEEPGIERAENGAQKVGCPRYARLAPQGFFVDPPIIFAPKSAALTAPARAALEEVAATMRANPNIGQVSVKIGTQGAAPALADERAKAILVVFRAGFLQQERFEVVLDDALSGGAVLFKVVR